MCMCVLVSVCVSACVSECVAVCYHIVRAPRCVFLQMDFYSHVSDLVLVSEFVGLKSVASACVY